MFHMLKVASVVRYWGYVGEFNVVGTWTRENYRQKWITFICIANLKKPFDIEWRMISFVPSSLTPNFPFLYPFLNFVYRIGVDTY